MASEECNIKLTFQTSTTKGSSIFGRFHPELGVTDKIPKSKNLNVKGTWILSYLQWSNNFKTQVFHSKSLAYFISMHFLFWSFLAVQNSSEG